MITAAFSRSCPILRVALLRCPALLPKVTHQGLCHILKSQSRCFWTQGCLQSPVEMPYVVSHPWLCSLHVPQCLWFMQSHSPSVPLVLCSERRKTHARTAALLSFCCASRAGVGLVNKHDSLLSFSCQGWSEALGASRSSSSHSRANAFCFGKW